MLIVAMDFDGIAFWKLQDKKCTVSSEAYVAFLKEDLPKWLKQKRFRSLMLLHDNARPHVANVVKAYLEQQKMKLDTIRLIL